MAMVLPETRSMQAAIVLAEELNFSRAAERMHVEQSTLSRLIAKLESDLGLLLFVRNHQNVEITEAGRHFVEQANHSVLYAERAVLNAMAASHGAEEILNIGKSAFTDPFLVTTLQSVRLSLYPDLKVKLWSSYSQELAHKVATGELDMALVTSVPDAPTLSFLTVAETPLYVVLSGDCFLADRDELRLEDLRSCEWILLASNVNPHVFEMIQQVASQKGITPVDRHYVMTAEEASELILEQRGIALLPRDAAWRIASEGLVMRPLVEEQLKLVTRLVTRSDNGSHLVSEYVRATGRKLSSMALPQQRVLPLTG
jgi:DNA-binding transcriptional LysR family regulator